VRTIGVVTVGRSDYGIYLPILKRIRQDSDLRLHLIVAGMHLSPEFGFTVDAIQADGFAINDRVEMLLSSDTPEGAAKSMGLGTIGFSQVYARVDLDFLVVLGDRFEMHAAAIAALPFKLPVAHIHGGEITLGAIDDALRHSTTKLSHLHFVSTQEYARRVMQLGEQPWRVILSGAPSLDNLHSLELLSRHELEEEFHLELSDQPFLLVTYHPVTLALEQQESQVNELMAALDQCGLPVIFTMPNADPGHKEIQAAIKNYLAKHPSAQLVANLGTQGYFSMMKLAIAMVGNSSSGIIEAASFKLPVVNIGDRQAGRVRSPNVIDVKPNREHIFQGLQKAIDKKFRESLKAVKNPYGTGEASKIIVDSLKQVKITNELLVKRFFDVDMLSTRKFE
jgi:UDP-hydrolysing UDP-N-acetyl-D-glucosamine 2-epimerase